MSAVPQERPAQGLVIRKGKLNDMEELLRLAEMFHGLAGLPVKFDPLHARRLLKGALKADEGCVFVMQSSWKLSGAIVGAASPHPIYPVRVATVVGWFVEPHARKGRAATKLLALFEGWARSKNCALAAAGSLDSIAPQSMDILYTALGYRLIERGYVKTL